MLKLYQPIKINKLELKNRIVMAPMSVYNTEIQKTDMPPSAKSSSTRNAPRAVPVLLYLPTCNGIPYATIPTASPMRNTSPP